MFELGVALQQPSRRQVPLDAAGREKISAQAIIAFDSGENQHPAAIRPRERPELSDG
jgi:hypothetical protein